MESIISKMYSIQVIEPNEHDERGTFININQ